MKTSLSTGFSVMNRPGAWLICAVTVAVMVSGCGGNDSARPLAADSDVTAGPSQPGVTPFISFVPLTGLSLKEVSSVRYRVGAKAGAVSSPVNVAYSVAALSRDGYVSQGMGVMTVPVFGLYANHKNLVQVDVGFTDGSRQQLALEIITAPYSHPDGIYDRPNILKARSPGASLGFSYFYMKTRFDGLVVVDTDGEVRWVTPTRMNGFSAALTENGFVVGSAVNTEYQRIELDGRINRSALQSAVATEFHHNIDAGKTGLLAEVNSLRNGVRELESTLVEFGQAGVVVKEWDFAAILGNYMRLQGDDPTAFIRPGVDWFHMNASTYDPRDNSVIASSRENFLVKLDYDTGNIIWIFGDPTKYWYSFPSLRAKAIQLEPGGLYPVGQHSTSITSDGLLMLFNNGAPSFFQPAGAPVGESRTFSVVSAYAIDPAKRAAREVWRFDNDQGILSDVCSSAKESRSGALLIAYATASNRLKARLVGLDASRNVVFDFEYASPQTCATSWNAEPIHLDDMTFN